MTARGTFKDELGLPSILDPFVARGSRPGGLFTSGIHARIPRRCKVTEAHMLSLFAVLESPTRPPSQLRHHHPMFPFLSFFPLLFALPAAAQQSPLLGCRASSSSTERTPRPDNPPPAHQHRRQTQAKRWHSRTRYKSEILFDNLPTRTLTPPLPAPSGKWWLRSCCVLLLIAGFGVTIAVSAWLNSRSLIKVSSSIA